MADYPKKINLNYIDQVTYLQGLHRSGWTYVLLHLYDLHSDDGTLCDTYVDRTFLWGNESNTSQSYIPYVQPWIGFVHHTFDTTFSIYNNLTLLQNENFLKSLPHCKGLFVFSAVSKDNWSRQLAKLGYDIPVTSLVHPTQFVDTRFTLGNFKSNPNRSIVQVGAWLRDNYAIYRLNNGKSSFMLENGTTVKKAALIGPKMEHYYKPYDFFRRFRPPEWKHSDTVPHVMYAASRSGQDGNLGDDQLWEDDTTTTITSTNGELPEDITEEDGTTDGMCRDIMCRDSDFNLNKYVLGAINLLSEYDESVITYTQMTDEEYDALFSENIIFLKMIDAAAINTLQECIVRNTPVVINPLPAVVEILGNGYPLYFDDISDVPDMISLDKIQAAYDYLVNMDKDFLRIATFMTDFTSSEVYRNL